MRCLARNPEKLSKVSWRSDVDVVEGAVGGQLDHAMSGIDVAVYLVHGIGEGADWIEREVSDALNFRLAAEAAGVERIVYLGGMGSDVAALSDHLASRHNVGRTLAAGPIPVCELRAAVVIGSGSASFEMLRHLVDVLPVMITPKWVTTRSQPIAISDVLDYLAKVIKAPRAHTGVYEIGGPDIVSYAQMMSIYAEEAGLRHRWLIPVPVLSPRLSSHWVGVVTPVPASLARPLVDSLINEVIVRDSRTLDELGPPQRSLREAIRLALGDVARNDVPSAYTDAELQPFRSYETDPSWARSIELVDLQEADSSASPDALYSEVISLGGAKGWHRGEWLWRLRGALDQLQGGPGLRRGRRHPSELRVGDFVDFWRVEELIAGELVRFHAEMMLPGEAWLEWRIQPTPTGTRIEQRARFKPRGLLGRAYWYAVVPFHSLIFPGLLSGIVDAAEHP